VTSERTLGRFDASVASLSPIRRLISDAVTEWGCHALLDDAVLCASELASNAILHTRLPFGVEVHRLDGGVRIEVSDRRPQELPTVVPVTGLATDITSQGTTGRGLQIVATVADRWGVTTDQDTKSVWVELRPGTDSARTAPIVIETHPLRADDDEIVLRFRSLPVRAAVASGMHLDGLVRELQLGAGQIDAGELQRLYQLLDESAPVRLEGRRLALQAASRDEARYDLTIHTSPEALVAVGRVDELMTELARDRRASALPVGVAALRAWLREETERQLKGLEPTPCPLRS
jgi:anti-sigma regulatory factor (Ser/Thr protein kinase)